MKNKTITQEEFEYALLVVKNYKSQNKATESKEKIVKLVLNMETEKIIKLIDYIFLENENLKYSEVVSRMHEFLNNTLLFKIGIRNVKLVFQLYLKHELILSKVEVMSSFKVYTKNKLHNV